MLLILGRLCAQHEIVSELGVHYRELRIVDPLLPTPYPASLFIREKALVVNLESLRMIITKDQVCSICLAPLTSVSHKIVSLTHISVCI